MPVPAARNGNSIQPLASASNLARSSRAQYRRSEQFAPDQPPEKKAPHRVSDDQSNRVPGAPEDVVFLRLPDVKAMTGLSKTSLYGLIRDKSFPAPVRLGPRAVAWVRSEVRQWAAERVHASRSAA